MFDEIEAQAWAQYQAEDPIIGKDCQFCPPGDNGHHQYKIKAGCTMKGVPSCEWCAMTEEVVQKFMAGEIQPLGPADIAKLM